MAILKFNKFNEDSDEDRRWLKMRKNYIPPSDKLIDGDTELDEYSDDAISTEFINKLSNLIDEYIPEISLEEISHILIDMATQTDRLFPKK